MKKEFPTQSRQYSLDGNQSPPINKDAMSLERKPSHHLKVEESQSLLPKIKMECVGGILPMLGYC